MHQEPATSGATIPPTDATRRRILAQARRELLALGYSRLTMDELAAGLGMSKKTLYRHFPGKDELVREVLVGLGDEVRADADAILADARLEFTGRLRAFTAGMIARLSQMHPHLLRDLQRHAPAHHDLILAIRRRHLPDIFGRLLAQGQRQGLVRRDLDPAFAAGFLLHALQGLMQPDALEQFSRPPHLVFEEAVGIFLGGLLTPAGRTRHEKSPAR